MTYNVSSGTLNLTHSLTSFLYCPIVLFYQSVRMFRFYTFSCVNKHYWSAVPCFPDMLLCISTKSCPAVTLQERIVFIGSRRASCRNCLSSSRNIHTGVPQGAVTGAVATVSHPHVIYILVFHKVLLPLQNYSTSTCTTFPIRLPEST